MKHAKYVLVALVFFVSFSTALADCSAIQSQITSLQSITPNLTPDQQTQLQTLNQQWQWKIGVQLEWNATDLAQYQSTYKLEYPAEYKADNLIVTNMTTAMDNAIADMKSGFISTDTSVEVNQIDALQTQLAACEASETTQPVTSTTTVTVTPVETKVVTSTPTTTLKSTSAAISPALSLTTATTVDTSSTVAVVASTTVASASVPAPVVAHTTWYGRIFSFFRNIF